MVNRLDKAFEALRKRKEGALIPLAPGDYAPFSYSMELVDMFAEVGADAVEICIPTRYPWMEGETMQRHQLEALRLNIRPQDSLQLMETARQRHPLLPFVAINFTGPVFMQGMTNYIAGLKRAMIDAVDVPDYPLARSQDRQGFGQALSTEGIYFIVNISTNLATTPQGTPKYDLLVEIVRRSGGFLFVMAQPGGVSGVKKTVPVDQLKPAVERVREIESKLNKNTPIIVVCGISTPEQVRTSIKEVGADGVMLGSAVSKLLQAGESLERVQPFVQELKDATRE